MTIFHLLVLAILQGLAELLPVSSSAHVVVAEKLMGMDPSSPPMTLLLVMLHTGTMFAVVVYFWRQWRRTYFAGAEAFKRFAWLLLLATAITAVVGEILIKIVEKFAGRDLPHGQVEELFSHLELIAPALAAAGILILAAGLIDRRRQSSNSTAASEMGTKEATLMGAVQGLCLPFRGFSRSGATISAGMLAGVARERAESFSFALAVILTPLVVVREAARLLSSQHGSSQHGDLAGAIMPSLLGTLLSFLAGLLALKWLSRWLETGRWYIFGIYCLVAAVVVAGLHHAGY